MAWNCSIVWRRPTSGFQLFFSWSASSPTSKMAKPGAVTASKLSDRAGATRDYLSDSPGNVFLRGNKLSKQSFTVVRSSER